jgi:hypothetical protein
MFRVFLIISSETLRELSRESLTPAFQINYSSPAFIVSEAVVIFSKSHFPHPQIHTEKLAIFNPVKHALSLHSWTLELWI